MNVLRFLSRVVDNALGFAAVGAWYGILIGMQGAFFGFAYMCIMGGLSVEAQAVVFGLMGVFVGSIAGAIQGIACGALAGLILGGCRWKDEDFSALHRGLRVASKLALLGGISGGITGMGLVWLNRHGPMLRGDVVDLAVGWLTGSVVGWCLCCFGGTLVGGLLPTPPHSGIPPLDLLLRWLWDEKWKIKLGKVAGEN